MLTNKVGNRARMKPRPLHRGDFRMESSQSVPVEGVEESGGRGKDRVKWPVRVRETKADRLLSFYSHGIHGGRGKDELVPNQCTFVLGVGGPTQHKSI